MIRDLIDGHPLVSSIGLGYTFYYVIVSGTNMSGQDIYLILVLSVLSFVYFKSSAFGGLDK